MLPIENHKGASAHHALKLIRNRSLTIAFDAIGFGKAEFPIEIREHFIQFVESGLLW
jgi:hypothetical protein